MKFRRTAGAFKSLNKFIKADKIVLCEGGQHVGYQDVLAGAGSDGTIDALYWEAMVGEMGLTGSFHFKSVGNKDNLISIAEDVEKNGINTITVCLDSDYDGHLNKKVRYRRVAYTHGYSWENDIVAPGTLEALFVQYVGNGSHTRSIRQNLQAQIGEISGSLVRWCEMDIACHSRRLGCLLDRTNPMRSIDLQGGIGLHHANLRRRLNQLGFSRGPNRLVRVSKGDVAKVCFGKLVAKLHYHIFSAAVHRVTGIKIQYDAFVRLAISQTANLIRSGNLAALAAHVLSLRPAF